ncbi:hypothetical protein ARHIZOSPH14_07320 [Agromyces rhizosphaerae]|uniref:Uncharacterized protein n=1 Tax=Agromyces rhizosphaerae TaxID=88374 RepID=A0A9W6FNJ3_9MICO|nr:hypothetical protein [Agromyces rhizosphaerae]GLI26490.1 hypothetical protein ARHIZOSPH14_07320 [Agromyces rhizosphaerae]
MNSLTPLHVGPSHLRTLGPVSLAQGVYGARGNLELLACDAHDGLWVFWCNADLPTDPPADGDVGPGQWSDGLHFAAGDRYTRAQIVQSVLGPDHLEVLALTAQGILQSWYWSPEHGFLRRPTDAADSVRTFALAHEHGVLRVTTETSSGELRHFRSEAAGYPERSWADASEGPGLDDDALAALVAAGVAADDVEAGTARAARSTRGGGTLELTWRDAATGGIRHVAASLE